MAPNRNVERLLREGHFKLASARVIESLELLELSPVLSCHWSRTGIREGVAFVFVSEFVSEAA